MTKTKIFTLVLVAFLMQLELLSDVPKIVSYQGVLVGADGKPSNGKHNFVFKLKELNGAQAINWSESRTSLEVKGGLFNVFLGDSSSPLGFPILDGSYYLQIYIDGASIPMPVPLYSSVYSLNIPDNTVTSAKIKDGEVKSNDLDAMGASDGQVLTRKSNNWVGYDVPPELPAGNEGDVLVNRNGQWVAEKQVGVPIGTIVAFYGEIANTSDIPDGWLLCDGSAIPTSPEYNEIRTICSRNGHDGLTPDLRGQFLRGAGITFQNPNNNIDPDYNSFRSGGSKIFKIGSIQLDAFQGHSHIFIHMLDPNFGLSGGSSRWPEGILYTPSGNPYAGYEDKMIGKPISYVNRNTSVKEYGEMKMSSETRPKNVAVNWIIKAK